MANELDETLDPVNTEGRDVHVIDKKSRPIGVLLFSKCFYGSH